MPSSCLHASQALTRRPRARTISQSNITLKILKIRPENKPLAGFLIGFVIAGCLLCRFTAASQDFHFDGSISRPVLENYLSRSISFTELLHDDLSKPLNSRGVDPRDNIRFLLETKAKFVGRALM